MVNGTYIKMKSIVELKKEARVLSPVIRIGKAGITENIIIEISKQLKKRKLLKVKLLKSFVDIIDNKAEIIEDVSNKTNSILVEIKGNTFVLYKN